MLGGSPQSTRASGRGKLWGELVILVHVHAVMTVTILKVSEVHMNMVLVINLNMEAFLFCRACN